MRLLYLAKFQLDSPFKRGTMRRLLQPCSFFLRHPHQDNLPPSKPSLLNKGNGNKRSLQSWLSVINFSPKLVAASWLMESHVVPYSPMITSLTSGLNAFSSPGISWIWSCWGLWHPFCALMMMLECEVDTGLQRDREHQWSTCTVDTKCVEILFYMGWARGKLKMSGTTTWKKGCHIESMATQENCQFMLLVQRSFSGTAVYPELCRAECHSSTRSYPRFQEGQNVKVLPTSDTKKRNDKLYYFSIISVVSTTSSLFVFLLYFVT